jgi:protein-S-isoprenylcysteine O-methyltransferase Ste14
LSGLSELSGLSGSERIAAIVSRLLIGALWLLLAAFWVIAARGAKPSAGGRGWRREIGVRVALLVLIAFALHLPLLRQGLRRAQTDLAGSPLLNVVGTLLCVAGIALALVARVYLGRSWGMPATRKLDPELVTSGPYARIRHPIYAGLLLAMLGSAVGDSVIWALPLLLFGSYFIYSARREERLLLEQFPHAYRAYMQHTGLLLPRVRRGRRDPLP